MTTVDEKKTTLESDEICESIKEIFNSLFSNECCTKNKQPELNLRKIGICFLKKFLCESSVKTDNYLIKYNAVLKYLSVFLWQEMLSNKCLSGVTENTGGKNCHIYRLNLENEFADACKEMNVQQLIDTLNETKIELGKRELKDDPKLMTFSNLKITGIHFFILTNEESGQTSREGEIIFFQEK